MAQRPATAAEGQHSYATGYWAWMRSWMAALLRNATLGSGEFPAAERALLTTCRFRAAAALHTLSEGAVPGGGFDLRYLALVHDALGDAPLALLLHEAHRDLCAPLGDAQRRVRLRALESALEAMPGLYEELPARFAAASAAPEAFHGNADQAP